MGYAEGSALRASLNHLAKIQYMNAGIRTAY